MASLKIRSRKDGAAIPLDDLDKRLMTLLQSSFPLAAEPYAATLDLVFSFVSSRLLLELMLAVPSWLKPCWMVRGLYWPSRLNAKFPPKYAPLGGSSCT